ncbi:TPA: hypothetical protein N0F65_012932, partial [Lagenidium giganteum]
FESSSFRDWEDGARRRQFARCVPAAAGQRARWIRQNFARQWQWHHLQAAQEAAAAGRRPVEGLHVPLLVAVAAAHGRHQRLHRVVLLEACVPRAHQRLRRLRHERTGMMGEVHYIRQKAREFFDISVPEDEDMVRNLWTGLFPTLPYEHHVNARWRDVGFQNDDLTSDLRASGRLGLRMLLYFADHMNDAFKRMIHDNNFPVCVCGLNVVEMLLIHLNLKDPVPLVCPCCGTDNAEMETNHPVRTRPELKGFASLVQYTSSAGSSNQLLFAEWPIDVAFAQVFMHSMLVLDAVWKQKLYADPSTNLLHFREALYDTRVLIIDFFATRGDAMHPITVRDLAAWSQQHVQAFDRKRGV